MTKHRSLIYVSTDIETNGPHIGKNSMLSLASAAFLEDNNRRNTAATPPQHRRNTAATPPQHRRNTAATPPQKIN